MKKQFQVVKTKPPTHKDWHWQVCARFDMTPFVDALLSVEGIGRVNGLHKGLSKPQYTFIFSASKMFSQKEVRENMLSVLKKCSILANQP